MATQPTGPRAQYVVASLYRLSDNGIAKLRADFLLAAQEHDIAGEQFHIIRKAQSEVLILSCPEEHGDQHGGIARVLIIKILRSYIQRHEELRRQGRKADESLIKIFEEATMKVTDAALVDTEVKHKNTTERAKPTEIINHLNLQVNDRQCIYGDHKTGHIAFLPQDQLPPKSKAIVQQCFERNKVTAQKPLKMLYLRSVMREDDDEEPEEHGMYNRWRHLEAIADPLDQADPDMVDTLERGIRFHAIEFVTATVTQDSSSTQKDLPHLSSSALPSQSYSSSPASSSLGNLSNEIRIQTPHTLEAKLASATISRASQGNAAKVPSHGLEKHISPIQPASFWYQQSDYQQYHQTDDPDSDTESFYTAAGEALHTKSIQPATSHTQKSDKDGSSDDDSPLDVLSLVSGSKKAATSILTAETVHKQTRVQEQAHLSRVSIKNARSKAPENAHKAANVQSGPASHRPYRSEVDRFGIRGQAKKEAELRSNKRRGNTEDEYQTEWHEGSSPATYTSTTPATYKETVIGGAEPWALNIAQETPASVASHEGLLIDVSNNEQFPDLNRGSTQIGVNLVDFNAAPLRPVQKRNQATVSYGAAIQTTEERQAASIGSSHNATTDISLDRLDPSPLKKPLLRSTMGQKARQPKQSGFESLVKEALAKLQDAATITIDFGMFAFEDSRALSTVYDQHELSSAFRGKKNPVAQVKSMFLPQLLQAQEAVQVLSISFDNDNLLLDKSIAYEEEAYFTITVELSDGSEEVVTLLWSKKSGFRPALSSSGISSISVHNPGHVWDAKVSVSAAQGPSASPIAEQILESMQVKHLKNGERSVSFQAHGHKDNHVVEVLQITMVERFVRRSENLMLPSRHEKTSKHMSVGWMVFRETSLTVTSASLIDGHYTAATDILSERYRESADTAQWQARMLLSGKVNQQSLVQISAMTDLMHHSIGRICHSLDGLESASGLRKEKKKRKKVVEEQRFW